MTISTGAMKADLILFIMRTPIAFICYGFGTIQRSRHEAECIPGEEYGRGSFGWPSIWIRYRGNFGHHECLGFYLPSFTHSAGSDCSQRTVRNDFGSDVSGMAGRALWPARQSPGYGDLVSGFRPGMRGGVGLAFTGGLSFHWRARHWRFVG